MNNYGRVVIYTDVAEINDSNIVDVLTSSFNTHIQQNRPDIEYLYNYYKGKQPILNKEVDVRPEINHKIVVNHANEIVAFKTGYLLGEPVQYVRHGEEDELTSQITKLNDFAFAEDKLEKDKELADWFTICGTAYRLVLPTMGDEADSPFRIYTLDPRNTFVVYSSALGNRPMLGVTYVVQQDGTTVYSAYTKNKYYKIEVPSIPVNGPMQGGTIRENKDHILGDVPIIEYPENPARLGAFEIVLPLLDGINDVLSGRLDGLSKFVDAFMVITGAGAEEGTFEKIKTNGGFTLPEGADAKYLTQELNQTQTQTLADSMFQEVLYIAGMPNRNGKNSTSDNGVAVYLRDGWSEAETRAKNTEQQFRISEKNFLRIALRIAEAKTNMSLRVADIEIRFSRRNYENILQKAQVLTMMLANDKIHPRLAFAHCGLFVDPELAYLESKDYYEGIMGKDEAELRSAIDAATASAKAAVNNA